MSLPGQESDETKAFGAYKVSALKFKELLTINNNILSPVTFVAVLEANQAAPISKNHLWVLIMKNDMSNTKAPMIEKSYSYINVSSSPNKNQLVYSNNQIYFYKDERPIQFKFDLIDII